jgi:hypothetical protein
MNKPKKIAVRKAWVINPKTRVKESEKKYSRARNKQSVLKEYNE